MKHATNSTEKGFSCSRRGWYRSLAAGLVLAWLAVVFSWYAPTPPRVLASSQTTSANFSISPSAGPVGTVVMVHITNLSSTFTDGMPVQLGETAVFSSSCTVVADSQGGTVQNHSFSGWLRWPGTTSTGFFQVCARVGGTHTVVADFTGFFDVLSTTSPQITVAPSTLTVSKQATVSGTDFLPAGTNVNLLWHAANGSQALSLGTATSDSTGAFTQTFTVPSKSSTGSYVITATVGTGQPATLSASITFQVIGITIVAVPTPVAQASPTPTASPTALATATVSATPTGQITNTKISGRVPTNSSAILPLVTGGLVLIVAALVAGVLFVRRQRELAMLSGLSKPAWSAALAMSLSATFPLRAISRASGLTGKITAKRARMPNGPFVPDMSAIPFDPALAEAMRQAQVSLFATPRPPIDEKVPL